MASVPHCAIFQIYVLKLRHLTLSCPKFSQNGETTSYHPAVLLPNALCCKPKSVRAEPEPVSTEPNSLRTKNTFREMLEKQHGLYGRKRYFTNLRPTKRPRHETR